MASAPNVATQPRRTAGPRRKPWTIAGSRIALRRLRGSLVRRLSLGAALWVGVLGITIASVSVWQYWQASVRSIDAALHADAQALAARIAVVDGLLEVDIDAPPVSSSDAGRRYYGVYDAARKTCRRFAPPGPRRR